MNVTWIAKCGGIGTAIAAVVVLASSFTTIPSVAQESLGPPLVEPQIVSARNGVAELTLEAAPSRVTVHDKTFISNVYNGQYTPPVFRLRRGDELQLRLVNKIGPADVQIDETQATNLHYHGMSVSPRPPADDIYLVIPSLQMIENPALAHNHSGMEMRDNYVYEYRWKVPEDHDQGPFWYHSHAHGEAEGQVLSGLSGLFMIDGFINDWYPSLNGAQERILVLKDIELPGADDSAPKSKTINGQKNPTIAMTRAQPQIWQIGNVGADAFFNLEVEGLEFWILSRDGNPLETPYKETPLWLPPGARMTVFITAPATGQYRLISREIDTGPQGDPNPRSPAWHHGRHEHAAPTLPLAPTAGASRTIRFPRAGERNPPPPCFASNRSRAAASSRSQSPRMAIRSISTENSGLPIVTTRCRRWVTSRSGRCATSLESTMCSTSTRLTSS